MDKRNESATIHQLEHANAILEAKLAAARKADLPLTTAAPVTMSRTRATANTKHPDAKPAYMHQRPTAPTKSSNT